MTSYSSACISASGDRFLEALRSSRLLSLQQVESLPDLPPSDTPDGRKWASGLVASGILTEYQAEQLLAGQGDALVLGQYRILDRLGAGGMGQVYKAEHVLMKRLVALKVIVPHFVARDASAVARFHGEVQVAAQLSHPNIVTAFDADEANGLHFLVMEYVNGVDFGKLIDESGPLPVAQACEYIRQAALGLQHAHEHRLVHCDLKPSNLLVRQSVTLSGIAQPHLVKILDFGLARLISSPGTRTTIFSTSGLGSGFVGTPDYMAPEQAHDYQSADIRSDLYSLGCTFFYLLTGQVPYHGGTWAEKLLRHQFDSTPSAADLRPEVPADAAAIVQRLMAKEPGERFQTPGELAEALYDCLCRHGPSGDLALVPFAEEVKSRASFANVVLPHSVTPDISPRAAETRGNENGSPPRSIGVKSAWAAHLHSRRRLFWSTAVLGAVATGLVIAVMARSISLAPSQAQRENALRPAGASKRILVASMPGKIFVNLDAAIASAGDQDTIVLDADGPYATRPLSIENKSLTIKAGPGCRPRIEPVAARGGTEWRSLLACNRALVLEGLELCWEPASKSEGQPETTHLLYAQNAAVRLVDCHLLAPHGCALLVCRDACDVELRNCVMVAQSSAICVEIGAGPSPNIVLSQNHLSIRDPRGAALCFWKSAAAQQEAVQLHLHQNVLESGRALSVCGLERGIEVSAEDNTFLFSEAVLSCTGLAGRTCRQTTQWRGKNNHFRGPANWLSIDGAPTAVCGLKAWREYWNSSEAGSLEETPLQPLETAHHWPSH